MVTEKTLERINELYHKSKAEGLTDAELAEQKQLRADYVKAFRENLRGQLESIKIKNPDGSLIDGYRTDGRKRSQRRAGTD